MRTRKGHLVNYLQRTYCAGRGCSSNCYKTMLKLAVLENLIVNGIFAGNIDFDVYDVYDVVLIDRILHILQRNKIRKAVLEKYSSIVCCDGYY